MTIQQFQDEWAQLKAEWAALSAKGRQAQWSRYTLDIDAGCAGDNRWHRILWEAFELGEAP